MSDKLSLDYSQFFKGLNINKGDIIDVASDVASIMMFSKKQGYRFKPDLLIDALKELVGPEGTVMIRTFNWDFCHGSDFDIRNTPSRVGAFGNVAMKRTEFRRTKHPVYSWMVWGRYAEELVNMDNVCAYGYGSPFDFLYKMNGKQLTIGNTAADACTQMHHCEVIANVPYRAEKSFTGKYIDEFGNATTKTYSIYVRPLDVQVTNTLTDRDERGQRLIDEKIMEIGGISDELKSTMIKLHEITDFFVDDINENEGKFIVYVNNHPGYIEAGVDYSKVKY